MQWFIYDEENIVLLPRKIKKELINHFIMSDLFSSFQRFFNEKTQEDVDLLFNISLGFMPR